jgi:addiction module HigA family antidote
MTYRPKVHPGEIIRADFMEPLGLTKYALAKGLRMTPTAVGDIVRGQRSITAGVALRLSRYLGCSPRFWMNLQAAYDLEKAKEALAAELAEIVRHPAQPPYEEEPEIPVTEEDEEDEEEATAGAAA